MTPSSSPLVTRLLRDVHAGNAGAAETLLPLVYAELQGLARAHFSDVRTSHTLQPTALVHEAWLKLTDHLGRLEDRKHFFAVASRAMRQVLADHARGRGRQKRGGGQKQVTLIEDLGGPQTAGLDPLELDELLSRLAVLNARHARVVELRILGGLTIAEAAAVLQVSDSTVEADWFTAKAWLRTEFDRAQ